MYLVPSRALAGEVEAKLRSELGSDMTITALYGGADWGITDAWLTGDQPTVLIATVEKADALMRYLGPILAARLRSEEHPSELQSLMRNSYAVFCLKKKTQRNSTNK